MRDFSQLYNVPNVPAVYSFHSVGRGAQFIAYVGIADKLKLRIVQHLIRSGNGANGVSAVSLNPDHLTRLEWWEHPSFDKNANLKAAELVAFEILHPALRSRKRDDSAGRHLQNDESFLNAMRELFKGPATGAVDIYNLSDAIRRISLLEKRVKQLEAQLKK